MFNREKERPMAQAKKITETETEQTTDLTTTAKQDVATTEAAPANGAPPAFLQEKMKTDAGKGVSTAQEDNIVPLIYVLQNGSPQVLEEESAYIEGARPGFIWLRNGAHPIVRGADGIFFQPCAFYKDWVEWVPRDDGGGFVGRHDARPEAAVEKPDIKDPTGKTMIWTMPNGNQLKETRYYAGLVHYGTARLPYVIPFSGTGHTVARSWMGVINSKTDDQGDIYPIFSSIYKLVTKMRKNKKGTWYVFEASDAGFVNLSDYEKGKTINAAFETGLMKAESETVVGEQGEESAGHGDHDTM